jgi:hypothetical protein
MALFTLPNCEPPRPMILGFHATLASVASQIVAEQRVKDSANPWDWLGRGAYFWEDYEYLAVRWAEKCYPGEMVGVVKAEIKLGRCMDFNSGRFDDLFREAHAKLAAEGDPLKPNVGRNHKLDRAVIDYVCDSADVHVDTVRCWFPEGERLVDGSDIRALTHPQLCVRTSPSIGQITLVKTWRAPAVVGGVT